MRECPGINYGMEANRNASEKYKVNSYQWLITNHMDIITTGVNRPGQRA
jgi:hypothetical protein